VDPALFAVCKQGDLASVNDDDPSFRNPKNRDAYLSFKLSEATVCPNQEDGFFLQVRDSSTHSGDSLFYVLSVRKQEPSFELGLRPERIVVERGRTTKVPLSLRRLEGFSEDVTINIEGLPEGVTTGPLVIRSGQTAGSLELTTSAGAPEGTVNVKISGTAMVNGKASSRPAVLSQPMLGDGIGYLQTAEQSAFLSIIPAVQFSLDRVPPPGGGFALERHHLSLKGDRRGRILVKIERTPEFYGPLDFSIEGLPEGVVLEKQELTENGQNVDFTVRAAEAAQVSPGEYKIAVVAAPGSGQPGSSEATKAFFLRVEN